MKVKLLGSFLIIMSSMLYLMACDNSVKPGLEDSLELFAGLEAVPQASNTTLTINEGSDIKKDGYFSVKISGALPHNMIKNVETEAWCLEWKKPLRSNNDVHEGVRWFDTSNNSKWKPLNYFFSIRHELQSQHENLTQREIQAVVWVLSGYMGIAPEFNVDKLRDSELPSRLRDNGRANFDRELVKDITAIVLSNYSNYTLGFGGFALQTQNDEQDIFVPILRIELLPNPLAIGVGETRTMSARVFDDEGEEIVDPEIEWSIDNESIATVNQNGMVTGVSVGQTTVFATSGGVTASATVNVTQTIDNIGNDFIIGMLPNFDAGNTIELHLTSNLNTTVTVDYPINNPTFTTSVSVVPGEITIVEVPNSSSVWNEGTVQNNAIRASSSEDFVMYAINRRPFSTDAAINLPVNVLGTDYVITSYTPAQTRGSVFSVVAAFDNTEVTIIPKNNLTGGFSAGEEFTITLNRGEGFLGSSSTDLTGTLISSSQPVSVTNGNRCVLVPPGTTACDHIFQVAHPLFSWTSETIAAPLPDRPNGSRYRVLAGADNTTIQVNGTTVATLNKGEFYETATVTGPQRFIANNPIFATQYMTGQTGSGTNLGDPAMGSLIPTEQFLSAYTFSTVGGGQFERHWLNIVAHNDDINNGTVLLDDSVIPFDVFTAISGTNFSYAQIRLSEGTHTTVSGSNPHGIYVIGLADFDSYIYPGGAGISDFN